MIDDDQFPGTNPRENAYRYVRANGDRLLHDLPQ
jgi:hypothetical protein